jgi:hypothetical protein
MRRKLVFTSAPILSVSSAFVDISFAGRRMLHPRSHKPSVMIEDAARIRGRIVRDFEGARATDDPSVGDAADISLLGVGPTGVGLAGAIADWAGCGKAMAGGTTHSASLRILLPQAGPRHLRGRLRKMPR